MAEMTWERLREERPERLSKEDAHSLSEMTGGFTGPPVAWGAGVTVIRLDDGTNWMRHNDGYLREDLWLEEFHPTAYSGRILSGENDA